jgi:cysteine dioxygenase
MKVLQGTLTETLYSWPCEQQRSRVDGTDQTSSSPLSITPPTHHACSRGELTDLKRDGGLRIRRQTTYPTDGVTYMSDTLGLHRVGNAHPTEVAVSLHLYTVSLLTLEA